MEMFTICQFRNSSLAEKNTMSLNQSKSDNFIFGLYEDNGFMIVYSIFNLCMTVTSSVLLYSICWYERHNADLRFRTLINQLLSHVCLASLLGAFVARIPHVLIHMYRPATNWRSPPQDRVPIRSPRLHGGTEVQRAGTGTSRRYRPKSEGRGFDSRSCKERYFQKSVKHKCNL